MMTSHAKDSPSCVRGAPLTYLKNSSQAMYVSKIFSQCGMDLQPQRACNQRRLRGKKASEIGSLGIACTHAVGSERACAGTPLTEVAAPTATSIAIAPALLLQLLRCTNQQQTQTNKPAPAPALLLQLLCCKTNKTSTRQRGADTDRNIFLQP